MHLSDDVALSEFVDHCPSHLTGADFYALCSDAVLHAMSDIMKELELGMFILREKKGNVEVVPSDILFCQKCILFWI